MLEHDAVRRNLATLSARGVRFVDPGQGYLACGWIGKGRLAEPEDIVEAADRDARCRAARCSAGFVVVTAGPTYEDIDAVRFIGNRSSGKMGYAVAAEAARRGARVVLVSGPSQQTPPAGVEVIAVRSAHEMQAAVQQHAAGADIVVMAAAVADYTPDRRAAGKLERTDAPLDLRLVPAPDILAGLGRARGDGRHAGPGRLRGGKRRPGRARTREAAPEEGGLHRRERHLPIRRRLRRRYERRRHHQRRAGRGGAARAQVRDRRDDPGPRGATARGPESQPARALSSRPMDHLAEHLRFYQELGVTGVSRDREVAPARRCGRGSRRSRPA